MRLMSPDFYILSISTLTSRFIKIGFCTCTHAHEDNLEVKMGEEFFKHFQLWSYPVILQMTNHRGCGLC